METFVVTSNLHNLGNKRAASADTYYADFAPRPARLHPLFSVATLLVGAFLTFGLPL